MLNIIDNFIKPRFQNDIERLFLSNNFPYYYTMESVYLDNTDTIIVDKKSLDVPQFYHMFITDGQVSSQYYNHISSISNKLLDTIDVDCYISRCKLNMNTIDGRFENTYHTPHIDNRFEEQITAIYYVNDSDGDTFFFDKQGNITERLTPKKGRLVWWKGIYFHAKSSPIDTINRLVLNFNLLPSRT